MSNCTHAWAMPSPNTFSIPPIRRLVEHYLAQSSVSVDPFARTSNLATYTNDLDVNQPTLFHMESAEFAEMLVAYAVSADLVLFDPPYSYRQAVEVYQGVGRQWLQSDQQQMGRWSRTKDALSLVLQPGGHVISCGWNTNGFGKKRGFSAVEYLIVAHGSAHNDTLVTVERKNAP